MSKILITGTQRIHRSRTRPINGSKPRSCLSIQAENGSGERDGNPGGFYVT